MRRELNGYTEVKMHEFCNKDFSALMSEVALYAASVEDRFPEFHATHEWDQERGHVVYLYEQYS